MFGAKPELSISIDDVNKPIWTTDDVVSGTIRLFSTSRVSIIYITVALHCDEIAAVSQNANERVSFKGKDVRRATKTVSETISHFTFSQDVLAFDESTGPLVLEAGEHFFPFKLELTNEIKQGPPASVVIAENGVESGVKWYLKAVARRSKKSQKHAKAELGIPVFPRDTTRYLTVGPKMMIQQQELSGHKYMSQKLGFWDKMGQKKTKLTGASVEATLKFPGDGLPQKPQPPQFQLFIAANEAPAMLNSIKIELLRRCEVTVKEARDLYTTRHLIGAATVPRKLIEEQDFTSLITGITLPQVFTPAFCTRMLNVYYELSLTVGFLPIVDDVLQKEDSLCIATPVKLKALPFEKHSKTVTFQEVTVGLNEVQRPRRRLQTARSSAETYTSGTTGMPGTWAGVEIKGPREYISSWLGSLTGH